MQSGQGRRGRALGPGSCGCVAAVLLAAVPGSPGLKCHASSRGARLRQGLRLFSKPQPGRLSRGGSSREGGIGDPRTPLGKEVRLWGVQMVGRLFAHQCCNRCTLLRPHRQSRQLQTAEPGQAG